MATKRTTLKGGISSIRGSSGAAHSAKFGNKLAPGDGALPDALRTKSSDSLPGSPKGPRVGSAGSTEPPPPVKAGQRGKKGRPVT